MWERHTQGYALALLGGGGDMESRMPSLASPAPRGSWQKGGNKSGLPPPMGEPGGHARGRGNNTSLTSPAWLGERSCLPTPAILPTAGCVPQTFSGRPLGARAWLDTSLLLRCIGLLPASTDSVSQNPQRPEPWVHRHQSSPQAPAWFPGPALGEEVGSRPGSSSEGGGRIPPAHPLLYAWA